MNKNELRSIMAKFGDNNQTLAEALRISPQAISCKINNKRKFTYDEINGIIERYSLNGDDVLRIFFA